MNNRIYQKEALLKAIEDYKKRPKYIRMIRQEKLNEIWKLKLEK